MMAHKFVSDIAPGETIDDIFMITQPVLRSTTRGDLYIAMFVGDRTGKLNGRMWNASENVYNSLPKEGFVRIQGKSEVYQNALQLVINQISVVTANNVSLDDYLARTTKNVKEMFDGLTANLEKIKNEQLRNLIRQFLNDAELMKKFCKAPAAMSVHHGYLGGLLEHTSNMLEAAIRLFPLYPQIQQDLVIAGIFLHDIGKTEELAYAMAFSYTDSGQLVGHITKSAVMVSEKANKLAAEGKPVSNEIVDALLHIILSHHGQYEFGSPKIPATAEAFMVSYIDNIDAKLNQVNGLIENDQTDDNWTPWQKTLDSKVYKKRVVE
jgi:3'-5' exoribonuclease